MSIAKWDADNLVFEFEQVNQLSAIKISFFDTLGKSKEWFKIWHCAAAMNGPQTQILFTSEL